MVAIMAKHKSHVEVVPVDYKYSIGNQGRRWAITKNDAGIYFTDIEGGEC
jgi:DNA adenine methylase